MKRTQLLSTIPKLRKIAHLADIHIRLFKRHDEYREAFALLYAELRDKMGTANDWAIVVAGDIVHAKTDLSPEMVDIASEFLHNLAELAPTIVIAGNHDFNMANTSRLDSLTPIVNNIKHNNLHYLKHSGIYSLGDVEFAVHSIIGESAEWPTPADCQSTDRIALFHGPVYSATTDVGFTITSRHHTLDIFDGYDVVLLGDIHRHQVLQEYDPVAGKPIVVYASSLVQQNHGETLTGHGWCEWDIETRTFKFHELKNTHGYYTLRVENGKIPTYTDMPDNVYLRIFAGSLDLAEIKKLVARIRMKRNVIECSVSNFEGAKKTGVNITAGTFLDINDIAFQNKLLTEWLQNAMPNLPQDMIDRVLKLNSEKNAEIAADELARKTLWKPISIKFDNLFTYGESNSINFTSLAGVAGVFAPNASGKTSIAEAVCFALFDRTPRTQKAVNIMNTRQKECFCEFVFEIDGLTYTIQRKGTRNKKGEVKIDVDFWRIEKDGKTKTSLNGEERRYTNKNIAGYVGGFEEFLLTTFSSSSSDGLFVDRGQSDRKDLLSQFMGLNIFDKLHTKANDESKEIAGALKRFKNDDFTQALVDVQEEIDTELQSLPDYEVKVEETQDRIEQFTKLVQDEYEKKTPLTIKVTNRATLERTVIEKQASLKALYDEFTTVKEAHDKAEDLLARANEKIRLFEGVEEDYKKYQELLRKKDGLETQLRSCESTLASERTMLAHASAHEYNPTCQFCVKNGEKTIRMKITAENRIAASEKIRIDLLSQIGELSNELGAFGDIQERHHKLVTGRGFIAGQELTVSKSSLRLTTIDKAIVEANSAVGYAERDLAEFDRSFAAIEENMRIDEQIRRYQEAVTHHKGELVRWRGVVREHEMKIALLKQRKDDMLKRIKEAEELESKYEAYEAYLAAVCRDGLPYKLIADVLPAIETAVNEILGQMVDFTLIFETDGKNINMKIRYDDDRIWASELASGMEKFLISMAIRVALSSLSSLPKSTFLIVDEGFGTLDADKIASVSMMFDVLRTKFDFILLISHIDSIRDVADTLIEIKRDNGYSQIKVA